MPFVAYAQPPAVGAEMPPIGRLSGQFRDSALETRFRVESDSILVRRDRIMVALIFVLETILILVDQFKFQSVPQLGEMRIGLRAFYMLTLIIAFFHYFAADSHRGNTPRFIVFCMLVHNLVIATYHHPYLTSQMTPGFLLAVYIFTITAYYTFLSARLSGTLLVCIALGAQYMGLRWWFDAPDLDQIYAPFLLFGLVAFSHITAASQARLRRQVWHGEYLARQRLKIAEEARGFRTRLLELVGHDLNQPLGALRYSVAALRVGAAQMDSSDSERSLLMAEQVSRSLDQIVSMLDKALELAQLGNETVAIGCRAQSAEPLAAMLHEQFATVAALNGVELRIHGANRRVVYALPLMMPVLRNLIRNALEYHNHQTRRPRVLLAFRGKASDRIDLVDNGGGLPDAVMAAWAHASPEQCPDSGGLGLVIAHQFARQQGWQIEIDNRPGSGVRFRLNYRGDAAANR